MKKIIALALALVMLFAFAACSTSTDEETTDTETVATDIKIGVILVGDENEGYTAAHMEGISTAAETLGVAEDQIIWKYTVEESTACYDAAAELADAGCTLIIANSYGHGTFIMDAAADFPEVDFVAMTGDDASNSGLDNIYNAFTDVYEARYISGVVAGLKIAELVENGELSEANYDEDGNVKIGYVGAYAYAEVVSGYTAFFLGIQSVYPDVVMDVQYTFSWFDIDAEKTTAESLIASGCVIIGQHADSYGAPQACQTAQENGTVVYSVSYNVDMMDVAPDAVLTSSTNNWAVYYEYLFSAKINGEEIAVDWSEGYSMDAVGLTELNTATIADGTEEAVEEAVAGIIDGSIQVFDTSTFTVDGETMDSTYEIDLTVWGSAYVGEVVQPIIDGAFSESTFRSAPYFELRIDGITELNG
ncbi:MAG: BMP family ABC transporter substrate-binding protein [Clostridia bacterium]